MKRLTKIQLANRIIDLIGADCRKTLLTYKQRELEEYWESVQKKYPTITLQAGYSGKHTVTYCYWNDTDGRKYATNQYLIEVVKSREEAVQRIQLHKENFKENTIVFWPFEYPEWMKRDAEGKFQGTHIFKHSPESEVGVMYGGVDHKVFTHDAKVN